MPNLHENTAVYEALRRPVGIMICTDCGEVADFTVPDALERALDEVAAQVERTEGFRSTHHRLDLFGRCAACH